MSRFFEGAHNVDARYCQMNTYTGSVVHHDNSINSTNQNTYSAAASHCGLSNDTSGSRSYAHPPTVYNQSVVHDDRSQNSCTRNTYETTRLANEFRRSAYTKGKSRSEER